MRKKCVAIVLAAGQGKRMGADVPKQYLPIGGKPVLYYSLRSFEESFVDEIILVTAESEMEYCRTQIVEKYGFSRVSRLVAGGTERYHSVYRGLMAIESGDYVFIHDGARPFVTGEILERAYACVDKYDACVVGVPTKDTVKIADTEGFAASTPERSRVWVVQTPQAFALPLIRGAYRTLISREQELLSEGMCITDDATVVETLTDRRVKLVEGSYENIKITTPEDLRIAEALLKRK